jgi:CTP synthase (UTP-ammonia lyase)
MSKTVNIGIIGDYDPNKLSHPAAENAIRHAADSLSLNVSVNWLPTPSFLTKKGQNSLTQFDCVWASSGSPYKSLEGAMTAIKLAREMDRPFIGT